MIHNTSPASLPSNDYSNCELDQNSQLNEFILQQNLPPQSQHIQSNLNEGIILDSSPLDDPDPPLLNQNLIPHRNHIKHSCCEWFCISIIVFMFILIFLSIALSFYSDWFRYCYFSFGLKSERKVVDKKLDKGGGKNDLINFYDSVCEPDKNYFPLCPDFCDSIKPVRLSGNIMIVFGAFTAFVDCFLVVSIVKNWRFKRAKVSYCRLYLMSFTSLILYLTGFITYVGVSKFSKFKSTKKDKEDPAQSPSDFVWVGSFGSVIGVLGFQFGIICIIKLMGKVYR